MSRITRSRTSSVSSNTSKGRVSKSPVGRKHDGRRKQTRPIETEKKQTDDKKEEDKKQTEDNKKEENKHDEKTTNKPSLFGWFFSLVVFIVLYYTDFMFWCTFEMCKSGFMAYTVDKIIDFGFDALLGWYIYTDSGEKCMLSVQRSLDSPCRLICKVFNIVKWYDSIPAQFSLQDILMYPLVFLDQCVEDGFNHIRSKAVMFMFYLAYVSGLFLWSETWTCWCTETIHDYCGRGNFDTCTTITTYNVEMTTHDIDWMVYFAFVLILSPFGSRLFSVFLGVLFTYIFHYEYLRHYGLECGTGGVLAENNATKVFNRSVVLRG